MRWSQNKKWELLNHTPLANNWELLISAYAPIADKFLYRELVRVNAYKCAKFQVHSSISYRDMEVIPEYKVGAADLPRRPLAVKLLYLAIVPANACQHTKFQLSGLRA